MALFNGAVYSYDRECKELRSILEKSGDDLREAELAVDKRVDDASREIRRDLAREEDVVRHQQKRMVDAVDERDAALNKVAELEHELLAAREVKEAELLRSRALNDKIMAEMAASDVARREAVASAESEAREAMFNRYRRFSDKVKGHLEDRRLARREVDLLTERRSVVKCLDMLEQHFSVEIPSEFRSKAEADRDAQLAATSAVVVREVEDRDLDLSTFGLE